MAIFALFSKENAITSSHKWGFEQSCTPDQKERSMKMDPNYKIYEIAGGTIVVNQGTANVNMTRIISLDASARRLYQTLA